MKGGTFLLIFTFEHCTATRIVDGDTIVAVVDTGFDNTHTDKFRLQYIDAPEVTGATKALGLISEDWLADKIFGKKIKIVSTGKDKYGRWLAIIYLDGVNINQLSMDEGMSKPY